MMLALYCICVAVGAALINASQGLDIYFVVGVLMIIEGFYLIEKY